MPIQSIEVILTATMIGAFMLMLTGLIAGLSILRQRRLLHAHRAETQHMRQPDLTVALSQLKIAGTPNPAVLRLRSAVTKDEARKTQEIIAAKLPKRPQMSVHDAQPAPSVIQIEPDLVSDSQVNARRLIDYLKTEMERAKRAS